jgi:DNA-binding PadR family transcriptional regulator
MMIRRSPRNGAEIMTEIETMTQGWWRPSPGSVYPVLDDLAIEGMIKKRDDGRYELTDRGKESIEWPFGAPNPCPQSVEEMLNEINGLVSYFEDLDKSDKNRLEPHREKIKGIANRMSQLSH